jgi:hypothetical protein
MNQRRLFRMKDKLCLVSSGTYEELKAQLIKFGQVLVVPDTDKCYNAINYHVDIHLFHMNEIIFIDRDTFSKLYSDLNEYKPVVYDSRLETYLFGQYQIKPIDSILANRYPLSVCFNAKSYGNTFVHNLSMTEPLIMDYVKNKKMKTIHVKQGYTGCSLVLLNEKCGITSDKGIYRQLVRHGTNVLLIREGFIELNGFEHGFIGGATGIFDKTVIFNGDSLMHPDGEAIESFIFAQGYSIIKVKGKVLKDVGSAIILDFA